MKVLICLVTVFVRYVKEIQWSDNAFSSLVLPEYQKDLILALTESQRVNRGAFDDVIQGKGMHSRGSMNLSISDSSQVWA